MVTPFLRQMYSGMVPGLLAGRCSEDDCSIAIAPLAEAVVRLCEQPGAAPGFRGKTCVGGRKEAARFHRIQHIGHLSPTHATTR